MAIRIDERARAAVARRRHRGRDATILVDLASLPAHGGMRQLVAGWTHGAGRRHQTAGPDQGGVTVHLGPRLARYAKWHDVTISARRLGPFEQLTVVDEPRVLAELLAWERTHPRAENTTGV